MTQVTTRTITPPPHVTWPPKVRNALRLVHTAPPATKHLASGSAAAEMLGGHGILVHFWLEQASKQVACTAQTLRKLATAKELARGTGNPKRLRQWQPHLAERREDPLRHDDERHGGPFARGARKLGGGNVEYELIFSLVLPELLRAG